MELQSSMEHNLEITGLQHEWIEYNLNVRYGCQQTAQTMFQDDITILEYLLCSGL